MVFGCAWFTVTLHSSFFNPPSQPVATRRGWVFESVSDRAFWQKNGGASARSTLVQKYNHHGFWVCSIHCDFTFKLRSEGLCLAFRFGGVAIAIGTCAICYGFWRCIRMSGGAVYHFCFVSVWLGCTLCFSCGIRIVERTLYGFVCYWYLHVWWALYLDSYVISAWVRGNLYWFCVVSVCLKGTSYVFLGGICISGVIACPGGTLLHFCMVFACLGAFLYGFLCGIRVFGVTLDAFLYGKRMSWGYFAYIFFCHLHVWWGTLYTFLCGTWMSVGHIVCIFTRYLQFCRAPCKHVYMVSICPGVFCVNFYAVSACMRGTLYAFLCASGCLEVPSYPSLRGICTSGSHFVCIFTWTPHVPRITFVISPWIVATTKWTCAIFFLCIVMWYPNVWASTLYTFLRGVSMSGAAHAGGHFVCILTRYSRVWRSLCMPLSGLSACLGGILYRCLHGLRMCWGHFV